MARIASHHANDPWRPVQNWPEDTLVQWGRQGVVFVQDGKDSYTTGFFEAFPGDGSAGFIRGEGATLEEAEEKAFQEWSRNRACLEAGGHRWSRTRRLRGGKTDTYLNGGCFCRRCGAFQTIMSEVVMLGAYKAPLTSAELNSMASGFCRASPWSRDDERSRRWRRRMILRAKFFGIALPEITPADPGKDPFEDDPYEKRCARAVRDFLRQNEDTLNQEGGGLFGAVERSSLRRLMAGED